VNATPSAAKGALGDATIHEDWVAKYRTPEAQKFYEMAFDAVVGELRAAPGSTVLDAGCGSCAKSVLLAARGLHVVGADFSNDALRLAERVVEAHGMTDRITLRQADLTALPFRDGEFAHIVCWGVLMHVPDVERAFAELARVLAPGGTLVISEGNMHSLQAAALRWARRLLGRGRGVVERTPAGLVTHEDTAHGALVTRESDMSWYAREGQRRGLRLRKRIAGQFTEIYVLLPWQTARRAVHAFNKLWFRYVGLAGPAFANMLVFDKQS
jgi:SAM-dependent methyltransferase